MIDIPKSELLPIDRLQVDGDNPNRMTDRQHKALSQSIEKYGFIIPIITNEDYLIADGEQRLTVAQSLGMKEVPVIALPVKDIDRRLLRQVLNKLKGEHQHDLDAQEFLRIVEAGERQQLQDLIQLTDGDLQKHLDLLANIHEENPWLQHHDVDIPQGSIHSLGTHRLMCGDTTNRSHCEQLLEGELADLIYTDPPYGVEYDGGTTERKKLPHWSEWQRLYDTSLQHAYHLSSDVAPCYYWLADRWMFEVLTLIRQHHYVVRNQIIWNKNLAQYGALGAQYKVKHEPLLYMHKQNQAPTWIGPRNEVTVWDANKAQVNEYHPTQKPVELAYRAIKNSSLAKSIVLDLFGGGGSTLIACESLQRRCYMMEIDPYYCHVIINRWEQYTGKTAQQLN